ncbi:MAG: AIR synthase-related protein, partial [Gammaproteobacteria bacterium]|nr:AIR synthase-related protein [Gammaproteobacteria bacterium]
TAMIDVSDGLIADVPRLLEASRLGAQMELANLPLAAVGTDDALELALNGGDDYELCFCVSPGNAAELELRAADWNCPVTRIGTVQRSADIVWLVDGQLYNAVPGQFKHFS